MNKHEGIMVFQYDSTYNKFNEARWSGEYAERFEVLFQNDEFPWLCSGRYAITDKSIVAVGSTWYGRYSPLKGQRFDFTKISDMRAPSVGSDHISKTITFTYEGTLKNLRMGRIFWKIVSRFPQLAKGVVVQESERTVTNSVNCAVGCRSGETTGLLGKSRYTSDSEQYGSVIGSVFYQQVQVPVIWRGESSGSYFQFVDCPRCGKPFLVKVDPRKNSFGIYLQMDTHVKDQSMVGAGLSYVVVADHKLWSSIRK